MKNRKTVNGIWCQWSQINQAWLVCWNETLLRVISDRQELEWYLDSLGAAAVGPRV